MRLLPALLWLAAAGLSGQTVWKLSDALGSDRGEAPQTGAGKGWILKLETTAKGQTRTLFEDGKEDSVRLLDLDPAGRVLGWKDFRGGVPVWEVTMDPVSGLPLRETIFEAGEPAETASLRFDNRLLVQRTVQNAAGETVYEDRLFHWPDGRLRRLERDADGAPLASVTWSYDASGRLKAVWSDDPVAGEHRTAVYSNDRTEETIATATEQLLSRVSEAFEGGTRETKTEPGERQEVRILDASGRVTKEVVTLKGVVVQTKKWKYDGQGRILELAVESAGPVEVTSYRYQAELTYVKISRNGVLSREEVQRDGERLTVRLYDRGQLFLVETWAQGRRVKESYYSKGQIVRERSL